MTAATGRGTRDGDRRRQLLIAVGTMAIAVALTIPQLVSHHGDVSVFLRVGRYAASRPFVERDLPDPVLTPDDGHDGQQFYVVARSLPDVVPSAPYVDQMRYRVRRVVFPLLVAPFPPGAPTVWAMYGINLLAIGAAALAAVRLARRVDAPDWVALVVGLSPALVESLQGSLADGLAFALALWGVVIWRRSIWGAVGLFTLAALTRETTLVVPAACLLVSFRIPDLGRARWRLLVPFVVYLAWASFVSWWVPPVPGRTETLWANATASLSLPFVGWHEIGLTRPGPMLGIVFLVVSLLAAWQLRHRLGELALWLVFDCVLLVASSPGVAERPFNLARVAPLAVLALALAAFAGRAPASVPGTPAGGIGPVGSVP